MPRQFSQVVLLSLVNFQVVGEWPENQILIPDWTCFHCPGATLVYDEDWTGCWLINAWEACRFRFSRRQTIFEYLV